MLLKCILFRVSINNLFCLFDGLQLDRVLKWLGLTESEADSHVKWAVTKTVLMLIQHREARSRLAEAMSLGRSVGCCIDSIETALNGNEI